MCYWLFFSMILDYLISLHLTTLYPWSRHETQTKSKTPSPYYAPPRLYNVSLDAPPTNQWFHYIYISYHWFIECWLLNILGICYVLCKTNPLLMGVWGFTPKYWVFFSQFFAIFLQLFFDPLQSNSGLEIRISEVSECIYILL